MTNDPTPNQGEQDLIDFTSPADSMRWHPQPQIHTNAGIWLGSIRGRKDPSGIWVLARARRKPGQTSLTLNINGEPMSITRAIINIRGIPLSLDACMDPDPTGPRHVTIWPRVPEHVSNDNFKIPLDQFQQLNAAWEELCTDGSSTAYKGSRPRRRNGHRKTLTNQPDFPIILLAKVWAHIDEFDQDPGPRTAAGMVGASYWQLYRWWREHKLAWPDIVVAANTANPRKGLEYLTALEKKRRQQRI
jgi:hypothetical protein